jgi:hypothetical protein
MAQHPEPAAEEGNESKHLATGSNHYAEVIRLEKLGQWALEKDPALQYLHEAMQDWGERLGDPSRRPVCMTCPHEFHVNVPMPSAWMFVRLSVNKLGVPKHMILVGVCQNCAAATDDVTLLRKGLAELRRAFPNMPEFTMHLVQENSTVLN